MIDFYFDFSSPFGFLASQKIEALALKGEYSKRDFYRSARFHGLEYRHPEPFPVSTVAACRAFYSLGNEEEAKRLARMLFKAYFLDNVNIGEADNVLKIAAAAGCKPDISSPAIKDKAKAEVDAALAKGVFGSPYIVVDGEPFWGLDRFDQLDRWLKAPF